MRVAIMKSVEMAGTYVSYLRRHEWVVDEIAEYAPRHCDAYDVIVTDCTMRPTTASFFIGIVGPKTVSLTVGFEVTALNVGYDDICPRRVDPEVLRARIDAVMRRASKRYASVVMVGPVKVDLMTRQAYCRGVKINLTAAEFNIFAVMVERRGRVQSHHDLAVHLSNGQSISAETVKVHIYRLRKKLNIACGLSNIIRTINNVGYVVIPEHEELKDAEAMDDTRRAGAAGSHGRCASRP